MIAFVAFLYLAGCMFGIWLGPKLMLAGLRAPTDPALAPAFLYKHGRPMWGAALRGGSLGAIMALRSAALVALGMILTTAPWHLVFVIGH